MKQWEYKILRWEDNDQGLDREEEFNKLGLDGWEVFTAYPHPVVGGAPNRGFSRLGMDVAWLRRPLPPPAGMATDL
jgi:hypothetical protein